MKMPRLFSVYLLGLCLLLSQLPREIQGQKMSDVITLCGHELIVHWIRMCGSSLSQRKEMMRGGKVRRESEPPTETKPTTMKIDEEMLKKYVTKLQNGTLSALEDDNISSQEFQEILSNQETENNYNLLELISKGSVKLSRKKRQTAYDLFNKCCHYGGCTNGELLSYC